MLQSSHSSIVKVNINKIMQITAFEAINVRGLRLFKVLNKYRNKFDSIVYEMLFIRALKLILNVQSDSIHELKNIFIFFIFIIFASYSFMF